MMGISNIVAAVASFVTFGLFLQASASGVFELQLSSFSADSMRCCKSVPTAPECDCTARFRVCLKHYQARIDNSSPCIFGSFLTPPVDLSAANINGDGGILEEPIMFRFEFAWPGTYSLIVEALNGSASDNNTNQTPLARLTTQGHLEVGAAWSRVDARSNGEGTLPSGDILPGGKASLRFGARVTCNAHYYGPGCANLCRPRDDNFGHYTCSAAGDRVCLPGWEGDYCSTPRCLPGCHAEHGHCNKPNECLCHSGWKGPLCDQCERYPGCLNGGCVEPWNCICDEGWGGLFCNQDLNYCTNHRPCKSGGTCFNTGQGSYTCSCPPGFGGNDCEKRVDPSPPAAPSTTASTPPCGGGPGSGHLHPCLNGATCRANGPSSYVCECAKGWRGDHCETPETRTCADSPCRHGATCLDRDLSSPSPSTGGPGRGKISDVILRGYICKCPPGYGGDHCERRMDPCAERPCLNGGTCLSRANGTGVIFDCRCAVGFSGPTCSIGSAPTVPRAPCDDEAAANCFNGATCVVDNSRRGFHCACVPGYAGASCESPVDYCAAARPCANGGRCFRLLNDYECRCRPGFTGKLCSIRMPPPENGEWATGNASRQVAGEGEEETVGVGVAPADLGATSQLGAEDAPLSTGHVVVIATLSTAVPAAALAAAAVVALAKRRRKRERRRADEEARMQNERNAGVFGAEKRQKQHPPGTPPPPPPASGGSLLRDAHMIRNTWGFPEDGSAKNRHKCVNSVIVVEEVAPPPADVSANASVVSSVSDLCYALQRAAAVAQQQSTGHKQLNTEAAYRAGLSQGLGGSSVVGGGCGGKLVEKDFDNLRRASMVSGCIDKRISVLSVDSLVSPVGICNTSDSSMTKRSLEKEVSCTSPSNGGGPVYVIGEHLQEEGGGVVGSGMLATEV
ncbi:delta-like protein B [Hetaerina americana]|uniref:delta-like protein B n=1 Tax=Hetaerina americana TaxID=62018 RepID=UPI003A7F522C